MAILKTEHAKGVRPMPAPEGGEVIAARLNYDLAAALAVNDTIVLGFLPAGCVPVDFMLDTDDLDTNGAPTIVVQAGILTTALTGIDTTKSGGTAGGWIGSATTAQAGGIARATDKSITRVPVDDVNDLPVGLLISTGPATGATTGKIAGTLTYRNAQYNG